MTASGIRRPVVAGRFYEGSRAALEREAYRCIGDYAPPAQLGELVGGVAPHAGWTFSGPTAAKVFCALAQQAQPDVYVLFGASHNPGLRHASAYPDGAWETPLGEVPVDAALVAAIADAGAGLIHTSVSAHDFEHSIEVQAPFIQILSPQASFVPIIVPPGKAAVAVGEAVARAVGEYQGKAVLVASSDLTHYGMGYNTSEHGSLPDALPWMRENDMRIIRLVEAMKADRICPEATAHANACGAGAMAAAVAGARLLGVTSGRVLEYTTSAEVLKKTHTDRAVGYVGMVF